VVSVGVVWAGVVWAGVVWAPAVVAAIPPAISTADVTTHTTTRGFRIPATHRSPRPGRSTPPSTWTNGTADDE
jgi:hypothetical protein